MKRVLLLSVVTGLLGVAVNATLGAVLEDGIGLRWLYLIRGAIEAPQEVVIVSMDESSRAVLNLPSRTRDWPRSLHARLIDRLVDLDASAIAMDIDFRRDTDITEDEALAAAIARASNVVLVELTDQVSGPGFTGFRTQQPIPLLRDSARALAPAPIPDAPLVTQGWSFLEEPGRGEMPTLPAVTLQVHSLGPIDSLQAAFGDADLPVFSLISDGGRLASWSDLREAMRALRDELKGNAAVSARALELLGSSDLASARADDVRTLRALIRLYRDPGMLYLNFYGPPGTIRTIPFHEALDESMTSRRDVAGKAVFVGAGLSVISSDDQIDTYHTAVSIENGQLSGVEIQATVLANLLADEFLRPIGSLPELGLLWGFGACVVGVAYLLPRRTAAVAALLWGGAYYATAQVLFSFSYVLVPLVVPLLILLPTAFIAARLTPSPSLRRVVDGTCLVTDVAGYTRTSKLLAPDKLHELLDEYRDEVRRAVAKWSGSVETPPVGDSVVCFWAGPPADRSLRHRTCMAALELTQALTRFNADHPHEQLPTRMGLHVGQLSVEQDVDGERCRLAGHTVNVATRLEELNKTLFGAEAVGSSPMILASEGVIDGIDDPLIRYVGVHELKGVGARAVYQVVGARARLDAADHDLCERFAAALRLYERERWPDAYRAFRAILEVYPTDRPSHYFARKSAAEAPTADSTALDGNDAG